MIVIKPFDPEYLEQHVELGIKVAKEWKYFQQTPLELMKKQYSSPEFDPHTRLYALLDDQLVGFCTASQQSILQELNFPLWILS